MGGDLRLLVRGVRGLAGLRLLRGVAVHQGVRELPAAEPERGDEQGGDAPLEDLAGPGLQRGRRDDHGGGRRGVRRRTAVGALLVAGPLVLRRRGEDRLRRADAGHLGDGPYQLVRGGAGALLAGGGRAVVDQGAHGQLGEAPVDPRPHLVGSDEPHPLGQPGEAVRVVLVGPALGEGGVEEGADGLGVGALGAVDVDAAEGGVDREAADAPLAGGGAQDGAGVEPEVGEALAVGGGHGLGDLLGQLVDVVRLQRPGGEQRGQLGGVRQPLVDHVDDLVLLDGVEDLDEARVAEERRRAGGGQHGAGARVLGRQQVDPDGAAEFLVHRSPAAETVQTGEALLQPVAPGEFVPAVQLWGRDRGGAARPIGLLCALGCRIPLPGLPVARGRARLGGQRFLTTGVGHVDGSRAPIRHRRSCLPIRCTPYDAKPNCAHSRSLCTTRGHR